MALEVYSVSAESLSVHRWALAAMVLFTTAATAAIYLRMRWRGWWLMLIVGVLAPAATTFGFGAPWPASLAEFVAEVMLPLAVTVGLVSVAVGILLGWAASRALTGAH